MTKREYLAGLVAFAATVSSFVSSVALAGSVRTVHANDGAMTPVTLAMGHATLLRFKEKPKKVIVGNQNYFSIEFIENDITIQPLAPAVTNLFVYGELKTYGFILQARNSGSYDDVVNIDWTPLQVRKAPLRASSVPLEIRSFQVGSLLKGTLDKVDRHPLGVIIVDLTLQSRMKNHIDSGAIKVRATRNNKDLSIAELVFETDELLPLDKTKLRLLINEDNGREFSLHINLMGARGTILIPRRPL